jgi:hypothetical protein
MKKIFSLVSTRFFKGVFLAACTVFSQFSGFAQQNVYPANGAVGIGTSSSYLLPPLTQNAIQFLHSEYGQTNGGQGGYGSKIYSSDEGNGATSLRIAVRGGTTTWTDAFYIRAADGNGQNNGFIGIGSTNPQAKLEVSDATNGWLQNIKGWAYNLGDFTGLKLVNGYPGEYFKWAGIAAVAEAAASNKTGLAFYTGQIENVRITYDGVVLIGQTTYRAGAATGRYKLDVLGGVRANSIVVNTDGADFVFAKNYRLRPLSEVESFIQANHHLPEIAPAAQMQAEGVSVGELQTQLLQKVEELTLYLIEQNKQLREQSKQLESQHQKIEALEKQLAEDKK